MSFWIISIVLMLAAIAMLFIPVLRSGRNARDIDRQAQNVAIARERLRELEAERERGDIDDEAYRNASAEAQRMLADDLDDAEQAPVHSNPWPIGVALVILVPAISAGMYFRVGAPQHLDMVGANAGADNAQTAQQGMHSVDDMVAQLEARLQQEPNNQDGWFMLGRSYMAMQRYAQAANAFRKLRALTGDHPTVLVSLADALAMTQQGRISGEPEQLVMQALESEPNSTVALWLAGQAAMERGDAAAAGGYWRRARQNVEEPERIAQLDSMINAADRAVADAGGVVVTPAQAAVPAPQATGQPTPPAVAPASIRVQVSLTEELRAKVARDVPVFVFAKAVQGPPMPLAVARLTVGDLPAEVTLDDSMAMTPQMRLSSFDRVQLTARVALSGRPNAQSGDFESDSRIVGLPYQDGPVALAIERAIP